MTLLQPMGSEKRDQSWPAKGRSEAFARLNGDFFNAIDPKRTPGSRRSISAFGGKGPRAVYLAGGLIGSGGRGVTSATVTVVPGRSMSVTTTRTPFTVTSKTP
jgi:hypothetical protein